MTLLDQTLSPIINPDQNALAQNHPSLNTLIQIKGDIINNYDSGNSDSDNNPYPMDLIRPVVVQSWIRSKNYGLDPFNFYFPVLDKEIFQQRAYEKQFLLKAANPYIRQIESIFSQTNCSVSLFDEEGVILKDLCGIDTIPKNHLFQVGGIWTEKTVGTCAHALCLLLNTPIQLYGPEHYSQVFSTTTGSSAPIVDAFGNLVGTLTIASQDNYRQNPHTLGLVITMAWAIQKQFQLNAHSELLSATIKSSEEAVVIINKKGIVTNVNAKARKLFNYQQQDLIGISIESIWGKQPFIHSVLDIGKAVYETEISIPDRDERLILRSAQPIIDSLGRCYGVVLTLKKPDQCRKTPNRSGDAKTAFTFDKIIGSSPAMEKALTLAKHVAPASINVLLQGESGTGKEVLAQAIHNASRPDGPFIAVNCAAIPRTLIESELFGYEGGTFTGAERNGRIGKIQMADGGTLFLDEIGDMPLEVQPILLRVLEEKRVTRLGGKQSASVDFRLISATNKDLLELVRKKEFRLDLYYRLAVFKLPIPALHARGTDIIDLAEYFIAGAADKLKICPAILSAEAKSQLLAYPWPGNVRQLENAMLYALYSSLNGIILPDDLPEEITAPSNDPGQEMPGPGDCPRSKANLPKGHGETNLSIKEMEKSAIVKAMTQTNNHIRKAATILGISKSTLYRKIREYDLLDMLGEQ